MIHALRRRHRALVGLIAIACPALVFVALNGRTSPVTDTTPLLERNIPLPGTVLLGERTLRLPSTPSGALVQAAIFSEPTTNAPWTLILNNADQRSAGPDVLVYWQPNAASDTLENDAVLLGPYLARRENRFALPYRDSTGSVVFYSLAHTRVIAASPLSAIVNES